MEERLQARIDAAHRRTERLLMRAIQGDILEALRRGDTPLPIPPLLPRPRDNADQGAGPSDTSQEGQDPLVVDRCTFLVFWQFMYFKRCPVNIQIYYVIKFAVSVYLFL
ncbi:hypothetical protein Hanom_Chr16g01506761 [Helianthus anomalus]